MSSQDSLTNNCRSFWNVNAGGETWHETESAGPGGSGTLPLSVQSSGGGPAARVGQEGETRRSAARPGRRLLKSHVLGMWWLLGWSKAWPPEFWNTTHHKPPAFFTDKTPGNLQFLWLQLSILFLHPSRYVVSHPYSSSALRKKLLFQNMIVISKADDQNNLLKVIDC